MSENNRKIVGFRDLDVYQRAYNLGIIIMKKVIPNLPIEERNDLRNQLSRSSKAIPRLIAEGYAKKHQKFGFNKYLDDALAECNETIVSLSQCHDLYPNRIETNLCRTLLESYDIVSKQLYKLSLSWKKILTPIPNP
jgi:four helix bundle protein